MLWRRPYELFLDIHFKTNHHNHNHSNFWFVCEDWDLNSLQPQVGCKTCPQKMALGTMALLFPCMHQRPRCTKFLVDFTRIIMSKRNYSHVHMLKKYPQKPLQFLFDSSLGSLDQTFFLRPKIWPKPPAKGKPPQ